MHQYLNKNYFHATWEMFNSIINFICKNNIRGGMGAWQIHSGQLTVWCGTATNLMAPVVSLSVDKCKLKIWRSSWWSFFQMGQVLLPEMNAWYHCDVKKWRRAPKLTHKLASSDGKTLFLCHFYNILDVDLGWCHEKVGTNKERNAELQKSRLLTSG